MGFAGVSAREAEVLDALGRNRTNTEIAAELFISVRTVESHVSSLLRKLDAADRQTLARLARQATPAPELVGAPSPFTSFVGRRHEAGQLRDLLARARLVTVAGPGGIGKTRLVVEVATTAARSPGWFVDLLPVGPEWVVRTVAEVVGVSEQSGRTLEDEVVAALSGQSGLLVLDNCEHVLDAVGELAGRLLPSCPALCILATSREPISIPGEEVVTLGPMPVTSAGAAGDAAVLFAERAAAAGAPADPDDPTVQEICARLDGMPLAIELAAVRCASLGLGRVSEALADRMALLAGSRDSDHRHRSLRATLDWSFELLSQTDKRLLCPLGAFAGWFGPSDAVAVADPGDELVTLALGRLATKSLLVRRDSPDGAWFRPLETVRTYLLDRMRANGELDAALGRHLRWAADQAAVLEKLMVSGGNWQPTLDRVMDDLRTALHRVPTHGDIDQLRTRSLARALGHLCYGRRAFMEGHSDYRRAAVLADGPAEAVDDLMLAGHCAFAIGHGDAGYDAYIEAAETAAGAGLDSDAAFALALAAARGRRFRGLFRRDIPLRNLEAHYEAATALGQNSGERVRAQLACARAWLDGPEFASAERGAAARAVDLCRSVGDPALLGEALDALGSALVDEGKVAAATELAIERVALFERMAAHDPWLGSEQMDIRHMAMDSALVAGDPSAAAAFGERFAADDFGGELIHFIRHGLVVANTLLGDFDTAVGHAEAMRRGWERAGRPGARWMAPGALAAALLYGLRSDELARDEWDAFAEYLAPGGSVDFRAFTRARLALHRGDPIRAAQMAVTGQGAVSRWRGYLDALRVEIAAVRHEADIPKLAAEVRATFDRHPWGDAMLSRAQARATGKPEDWQRAADAFATAGALFEWACTVVLADGAIADDGHTVIASLGCEVPAV
ncbi:MAG: LuxR C-terminal-related transcriptional regulator [Actinomycetota bacterium]|nr:LuxR C-terminal-related transcriptional regulator [Actinomycetota bacterium]